MFTMNKANNLSFPKKVGASFDTTMQNVVYRY